MNHHALAHSAACERNTPPLLDFLREHLKNFQGSFLEIGFGTGQHAFAFTDAFKELDYFAADQLPYHPHLQQRVAVFGKPEKLNGPFNIQAYDQRVEHNLPQESFDCVFSANTLHIMSWPEALSLLEWLPSSLSEKGQLFLYGPFKFDNQFTSESNHHFDLSLKSQNPHMGIREFEEVRDTLVTRGLKHVQTTAMPANNHILAFTRN